MCKDELQHIIEELISLKKEGVYWDFKQEHHKNTTDLVHDIICLANTQYDGDRYIIYGVNDNFEIIGLSEGYGRRKQCDIIDTLRHGHFVNGIYPDILLEKINIQDCEIDILIIKNTKLKPYYLVQDHKNGKDNSVRKGIIYTRVMDTNTPKDSMASFDQIEYMWKERFGLTETPSDRLKIYLHDFDGWEVRREQRYFRQFPEFTIRPLEGNYCQRCETREWARGEIGYSYNSGNGTSIFGFFYHSTLLKELCCVHFDGGKKYIVNPDWEAVGSGRIYFYLKDSVEYIYQLFLSRERNGDDSKQICCRSSEFKNFDIPVFSSKKELKSFLIDIKKEFKINNAQDDLPASKEDKQNELFYKYLQFYSKWRNYM